MKPTPSVNLSGLLSLALPMAGAMASQALVNLVDTALVENLGGLALASVSIGSYLAFVAVALPVGFAVGLQSVLAQHATEPNAYTRFLSAGLLFCVVLAAFITFAGYFAAPYLIDLYVIDDRMTGIALGYFDMRLFSVIGVALSLIIRCFWASQHKPWQFTKILAFSHIINVPISYALIYGFGPIPAFGAVGAGLGTSISVYLGLILQCIPLVRQKMWRKSQPSPYQSYTYKTTYKELLKQAMPSALQQFVFSLHMAILFWLISSLGASALAASFAIFNLGLVLLLPLMGLGQATSTLVAQAWLRNIQDAWQWSHLALYSSMVIGLIITLLITVSASSIADMLLNNRDLIMMTASALPVYALALTFDSLSLTASRSLIASNAAKHAVICNIASQWLVLLPLTALVIEVYGFFGIWWLQLGYRGALGIVLWLVWRHHFLSNKASVNV